MAATCDLEEDPDIHRPHGGLLQGYRYICRRR